jgi:hypothetical protein
MAKKYVNNFCDDILDGNYTKINNYDNLEVEKDLHKTPDKGDIVLAVNKSTDEIRPEVTAAVLGLILTAGAAYHEIKAIIDFLENHKGEFLTNGIILGVVPLAIICGFFIKRTSESIGLLRFKFLATEYLKKEQPQYALDLYKSEKIRIKRGRLIKKRNY